MPYDSNDDLPKAIRDKYGHCASAFRGAFNSVHESTNDEGKAFAAAHSAAQRCQRKESSMTLAPTARLSPDETPKVPKFAIITKAISGTKDEQTGRRRFRATASSTITDRQGDEISLKALEEMAVKFREGITIFTDHKNEVANAFGTTDGAEIIQRGHDPKTGEPIWDLDITGTVNEPNPSAVQLHESITGGYVKFGASIDAFVLKHQPKQAGRYAVESLDVFAASIVGVPANQRSWTQKAIRAIKFFNGEPEEDESVADIAVNGTTTTNSTTTSNDIQITKVGDLVNDSNWIDQPASELIAGDGNEKTAVVGEVGPEAVAVLDNPDDAVEKSMCPDCGKGRDAEGCSNGYHATEKSVDDSAPGGQESAQETPETAPTADAVVTDPPVEEKAASIAAEDVHELLGHVKRLVKEIEGLRASNAAKDAEIERLKGENTAVHGEVELAKEVIGKVLETPLRSQTAAYVTKFTSVHKLFDPDIAEYLAKRGD